jgi:DNA-binding CsgD family transcriptional regulator
MLQRVSTLAPGDRDLIEREPDLARLQEAIDLTTTGEGSLVLVEGLAGIGKTRLIAECRDRAGAAGLRVLSARGSELERDFTHGVARQLFERTVLAAKDDERDRMLAGPAAHAADAIVSDARSPQHSAPGDSDFAAMHGLYWLAANLATERPTVLAIDDGHWVDAASLRFANYLANRLSGLPLMVVLATRPGEPGAEAALLDELAGSAAAILRPAVLSPAGSARIVRSRMRATDSFAAACHDSSGGNPFLLNELLTALAADGVAGDDAGADRVRSLGPQSVSRSVLLRLARLPAGATDFARAVAVLGDNVELNDAAALSGISPERASTLTDALIAAGVLAGGLPLCFIHPVILEAVSADLGPGERVAMHARAASILHARGASADRVASHLAATEPVGAPWATQVLRRAAAAAKTRGAPEVALRHLQRALREEQSPASRAELLAELGEAEWLMGTELLPAISHLRDARELATDPGLLVATTITLARAIFSTGDAPGAVAALEQTLAHPDALSAADIVRLEAELGSVGLLNFALMPEVRDRLLVFRDLHGESTEELLMLCNLAVLNWMEGTAAETADVARRALGGGRLLASAGTDTIAFLQAVWVLLGADQLDEAREVCEAGLGHARQAGTAFGFIACCVLAAMTAIRAGDIRECEAHARAGLELVSEVPIFLRPSIYTQLALALIERGELDEAEEALELGFVGPYLPRLAQMNHGFYARGLLRAAQGRDEEALVDLYEFAEREELTRVGNPAVPWRVAAARVHLRLGQPAEAEALVGEQEQIAARWDTPWTIGLATHARSALAEGGQRLELLERARELIAQSPYRLDEARVVFDMGIELRRAGRRREAQRNLAEAVEVARRCGATALATRANDELGVLSSRPRRLQFSGVDSLTASERRVALMAAEGQSNPQIAQALFVTAKTVENHLGRVYIKLAIKSRHELRDALSESSS